MTVKQYNITIVSIVAGIILIFAAVYYLAKSATSRRMEESNENWGEAYRQLRFTDIYVRTNILGNATIRYHGRYHSDNITIKKDHITDNRTGEIIITHPESFSSITNVIVKISWVTNGMSIRNRSLIAYHDKKVRDEMEAKAAIEREAKEQMKNVKNALRKLGIENYTSHPGKFTLLTSIGSGCSYDYRPRLYIEHEGLLFHLKDNETALLLIKECPNHKDKTFYSISHIESLETLGQAITRIENNQTQCPSCRL